MIEWNRDIRQWLLRRHRPVGGWSVRRRDVPTRRSRMIQYLPFPTWTPRVCAADSNPWPDDCPVIRALRAEDPELDHAITSGYWPNALRD